MPVYRPTPRPAQRGTATMQPYRQPSQPTSQPTPTPTSTPQVAYPPSAPSLAQGGGGNLTVTWTAPSSDSTHDPAIGFNLRSRPSGTTTWTTVSGVTSPYTLSGLAAGVAIDVQLQ